MPRLLWNASALAKRYAVEVGSATVDALFSAALAEGLRALNPELIAPPDVPAALHACDY